MTPASKQRPRLQARGSHALIDRAFAHLIHWREEGARVCGVQELCHCRVPQSGLRDPAKRGQVRLPAHNVDDTLSW